MAFYAGRLGSPTRLSSTSNTEVYQVPFEQYAMLNVSMTNVSSQAVSVRLAVATSATPDDWDWIEWDTVIVPNGTLERTSLMVQAERRIVVRASTANAINVTCYGLLTDNP